MRMGFIALATAASIAAATGIAAPASAHDRDGWHDNGRHGGYDRGYDRHDRWDRHDRRDWRQDRRWRHHGDDRYGYGYDRQNAYPGYYGW
jgi:hypothetical protein